jgi:hypothetical protein
VKVERVMVTIQLEGPEPEAERQQVAVFIDPAKIKDLFRDCGVVGALLRRELRKAP